METDRLLIVTWSALKSLDTGRLGFLGSLASGNLAGEELQYAVYPDTGSLPEVVVQTGSYCWVAVRARTSRTSAPHPASGYEIEAPALAAEIEAAFFVSRSRRDEFRADLIASGFRDGELGFPLLVLPFPPPHARSRVDMEVFGSEVRQLNAEIAYQERISAAIACAEAVNWWRVNDLPGLRASARIEKYQRLVTWARSSHGVVDAEGRWSRTSVEESLPLLEAANLGEQVAAYRSHVEGNQWPVEENSLIATAMLLLVRAEGGTSGSFVNQVNSMNGIALPLGYSLSDAMIYVAAAFGRHHLPGEWKPNRERDAVMVAEEIEHAMIALADQRRRATAPVGSNKAESDTADPNQPAEPPKARSVRRKAVEAVKSPNGTADAEKRSEQLHFSSDDFSRDDLDRYLPAEPADRTDSEP